MKVVKSQIITNSSQVQKVAYTEDKSLLVTFAKGTEYMYSAVPEELYEEMLKSESIGKFLNSNIKGKFDYRQLNVECPVLPAGTTKVTE